MSADAPNMPQLEPRGEVPPIVLICHEAGDVRRYNGAWFRVRWGVDSHIDFRTRQGLRDWLVERALAPCRPLPPRGERKVISLVAARAPFAGASMLGPISAHPSSAGATELCRTPAMEQPAGGTESLPPSEKVVHHENAQPTLLPRITSSPRGVGARYGPQAPERRRQRLPNGPTDVVPLGGSSKCR